MHSVRITDDFHWVGTVNFECLDFHGYMLSPCGTTHNAYVLKDEKNVLFDTVRQEHLPDMLRRLCHLMDPEKIDYIVVHHAELDHSGGLPEIVRLCKPEKIFCSVMGQKSLESQLDTRGWPLHVVKNGESVNCGKHTVVFHEARMLHWPDSMVSYVPDLKLLISNDIFGQNLASMERFADELPGTAWENALREYYHNIISPYAGQVLKLVDSLEQGLDIGMIAPDHGLVMRGEDVGRALALYRAYATQAPLRRALVVYDTMWHSTEQMAQCLAEGLREVGVPVRIMQAKHFHPSEIMTELSLCGALAVGSATHNNTMMHPVAGLLSYLKGLRVKNRLGAAFGSYGWSGEAPKLIGEWMDAMKFEQPSPLVSCQFKPTDEDLQKCREMGRALGERLDGIVGGEGK